MDADWPQLFKQLAQRWPLVLPAIRQIAFSHCTSANNCPTQLSLAIHVHFLCIHLPRGGWRATRWTGSRITWLLRQWGDAFARWVARAIAIVNAVTILWAFRVWLYGVTLFIALTLHTLSTQILWMKRKMNRIERMKNRALRELTAALQLQSSIFWSCSAVYTAVHSSSATLNRNNIPGNLHKLRNQCTRKPIHAVCLWNRHFS